MKRVIHIAKNFQQAEQWDIKQQTEMSAEERQAIATELKKRVYGSHPPDVREAPRTG